ncbi:DUF924 domain-containing protein [Sphingomonas rhizophila]|uniref:DUF924 domain-containing protein n=1 Tax=Sphingomonas rhizophila TaxID=2071607 RepID=A0A7G9SDJ6_9SPHN|nr:DUF924 family protein [Sphingomonas rhizophila]QNN65921.1 DUF924 domain-containing protein [Sphingomonas rhizophila]
MTSDAAQAVLAFWFDEVGEERWFAKDAELDAHIARRFGALRDQVLADRAAAWRHNETALTAAIVLLDQFSRNVHRGTARAFEADALALSLALEALERGWIDTTPPPWRQFLLMPLMHSEDVAMQDRSVAEFERLGDPNTLDFARRHRDQVMRFGRFPGRNKALGRVSTPEEREALALGAAF